MAFALLIIGIVAGLLSGLLGIGGGIVIVPAMTALLVAGGHPLEAALSTALVTSLAAVLFNSLVACVGHARRGQLDLGRLRWLLAGAALGAFVAAQAMFSCDSPTMAYPVAASQMLIAILLWMRRPVMTALPRSAGMDGTYGVFTGVMSALAGTGGGAYVAAYLLHRGAATSFARIAAAGTAAGAAIGAGGMLGYAVSCLRAGTALSAKAALLPPEALGLLMLGGLAATPWGVRWSARCRGRLPRIALGVAVACSALRLVTMTPS
jgi:uncharacterized membrane protein YfcA